MSANKAYNATMEERRDDQYETEEELKASRQTALQDSICGLILARLEREMKKYPDIRYTAEEIKSMQQTIFNTVKNGFKPFSMKGN